MARLYTRFCHCELPDRKHGPAPDKCGKCYGKLPPLSHRGGTQPRDLAIHQLADAVHATRISRGNRKKARPFKQKLATLVLAADSAGVDLTTICEALLLALVKLFPDDKDGAFFVGHVFFAEAQPRGLLHKYVHWHYRFTARRIAHLRSGKEVNP